MKKVILLNGLPRAGKDTLADYLVEKYGYTKMAFADELKDIICRAFSITRDELDNFKNNQETYILDMIKKYPPFHNMQQQGLLFNRNFREILQNFGEGMKATFRDEVWADILYKKIATSKSDKIVVSDFRLLNECRRLASLDIKTILIKDDRPLSLEGHRSDVELYQNDFKFDYTVYNSKDKHFFGAIDEVMEII